MDLTGFVLDDRDTALMAIGTAFGGLQTPIIKRVIGETRTSCSGVLTSTSGIVAAIAGASFIAIAASARVGKISLNKDLSAFMLGYGISCIISIMINYVTSTTLSGECH
jgi:hypothetical protein